MVSEALGREVLPTFLLALHVTRAWGRNGLTMIKIHLHMCGLSPPAQHSLRAGVLHIKTRICVAA